MGTERPEILKDVVIDKTPLAFRYRAKSLAEVWVSGYPRGWIIRDGRCIGLKVEIDSYRSSLDDATKAFVEAHSGCLNCAVERIIQPECGILGPTDEERHAPGRGVDPRPQHIVYALGVAGRLPKGLPLRDESVQFPLMTEAMLIEWIGIALDFIAREGGEST